MSRDQCAPLFPTKVSRGAKPLQEPDPLTSPCPCDGDFEAVCLAYAVSAEERRDMHRAFMADPPAGARAFRDLAERLRARA
jgi:hypothetical protein